MQWLAMINLNATLCRRLAPRSGSSLPGGIERCRYHQGPRIFHGRKCAMFALLAAGVMLGMQALEGFTRHHGVNLGGAEAGMAE